MIALLGALLGFISSTFPNLLSIWKDKTDKKHELAVLDRQISMQLEMQKLGGVQRLSEINAYGDIAEFQALHAPTDTVGVKWVDAMIGSVRPVITYLFMFSYMLVKFAQYRVLQHITDNNGWEIIMQMWGDEDKAIFATILGFWFGQRSLSRARGK